MSRKFIHLTLVAAATLAGCGGGEEDFFDYFADADETAIVYATWTPESTTQVVNGSSEKIYLFPLRLHQNTLTKSYVSKVGTSAILKYKIAGTMSTPAVSSGAYSADATITRAYGSSVAFEGLSTTPVTASARWSSIIYNGASQPEENFSRIEYFDTNYGFYVGSSGSSFYESLDSGFNFPNAVAPGSSGVYAVYKVYSDSTKSNQIGLRVRSYKVLSVAAVSADQYRARVEWQSSVYTSPNVLGAQSTLTQDLTYSATKGAAATTVSDVFDDVEGTTTSHLVRTRI